MHEIKYGFAFLRNLVAITTPIHVLSKPFQPSQPTTQMRNLFASKRKQGHSTSFWILQACFHILTNVLWCHWDWHAIKHAITSMLSTNLILDLEIKNNVEWLGLNCTWWTMYSSASAHSPGGGNSSLVGYTLSNSYNERYNLLRCMWQGASHSLAAWFSG